MFITFSLLVDAIIFASLDFTESGLNGLLAKAVIGECNPVPELNFVLLKSAEIVVMGFFTILFLPVFDKTSGNTRLLWGSGDLTLVGVISFDIGEKIFLSRLIFHTRKIFEITISIMQAFIFFSWGDFRMYILI